jgi:hypothetical protein
MFWRTVCGLHYCVKDIRQEKDPGKAPVQQSQKFPLVVKWHFVLRGRSACEAGDVNLQHHAALQGSIRPAPPTSPHHREETAIGNAPALILAVADD